MLASAAASLLLPLVMTTSFGPTPPPLHREVRAMVTGYNTTPGQTDDTPCIAASGVDICGRHDAVACPRRIKLGTTVEIRGTTYVCEDRLAKKYDTRFDISCDKDTTCPPEVTGWVTVKVYDDGEIAAAAAPKVQKAETAAKKSAAVSREGGHHRLAAHASHIVKVAHHHAKGVLASEAHTISILRGHG